MSTTLEQSPGEQRANDLIASNTAQAEAERRDNEALASQNDLRPQDGVGKAQVAANEAQAKADAARAAAEAEVARVAQRAQERADEAEAARPRWQTIHAGPMDITEWLVLPGGYLIRSTWRAISGRQGADPLDGNSMVFVEGAAPVLPNPRVMVLGAPDLLPGASPDTATLDDVHPIKQIATTPEVVLALGDGKVRVLKSRDTATVGTVRAATAADGVVA